MAIMDRLQSLPVEIQDCIFNYLAFCERLRFSTVSSAWRSLILNWPGMWTTLSTNSGYNIVPDLLPYKPYIRPSEVKRLCLVDSYDTAHITQVIDFVIDLNCSRIEYAELSGLMDKANFLKLTNICGNALTHVILDIDGIHMPTPDQVLSHCPNLRKLYYNAPLRYQKDWVLGLEHINHQLLVDLAINTYEEKSPEPILKVTPKLQRLALDFDDVEAVGSWFPSVLRQYCPDLVSLLINSCGDGGIARAQAIDWEIRENASGNGLEELVLGDSLQHYDAIPRNILRRIAEESHSTLTTLELVNNELFGDDTLEYLATFIFSSLTHLVLEFGQFGLPGPLCRLFVHSTPNLITLTLHDVEYADDHVLESIASGAKFLKRLELCGSKQISSRGLVQFLEEMAKPGRSLHTLVFRNIPALAPQALDTIITQYRVIHELTIQYCNGVTLQNVAKSFEKPGFGYRNVHKMDLCWRPDVIYDMDTVEGCMATIDLKVQEWILTLGLARKEGSPTLFKHTHSDFRNKC